MTIFSAPRGIIGWIGEMIAENPGSAGAVTAFGVAMAFFTANAVFFQNSQHPSALFATRPEAVRFVPKGDADAKLPARGEPNVTRFLLQDAERPEIPLAAPLPARRPAVIAVDHTPQTAELPQSGTADVAGIQELLAKLGYYDGPVDGLRGPMTNAAIDAYKNNVGLRGIELTDAELMTSIRNNLDVTAAIPAPRPKPAKAPVETVAPVEQPVKREPVSDPAAATATPDGISQLASEIPSAEVVKVQAALRAFGNTDVTVDGVAGEQTQAAIREFQSLFRLPVTGEIDGVLLDKMRTVGLIQ